MANNYSKPVNFKQKPHLPPIVVQNDTESPRQNTSTVDPQNSMLTQRFMRRAKNGGILTLIVEDRIAHVIFTDGLIIRWTK